MELLVVIALVLLLVGILVPVLGSMRERGRAVNCLANLHGIATALRVYASDHRDRLPDPESTQTSWEVSIRKYVGNHQIFRCAADLELGPAIGSSYDWRDTGDRLTTLAGRSLSNSLRDDAVMVFDALPEWHRKVSINVALLDASSRDMTQDAWLTDLTRPIEQATGSQP